MEADDTELEAAIRAEVAPWMEEHASRFGPPAARRPADTPERVAACREWQRELDEGGWGAVTWPVEHGGLGFGPIEARVVKQEEQRYAVPAGPQMIAVSMVGPTLMAHGTAAQQQRFLGPIRRGEELWCQLFSEPDAGSDLTSLRCKAERTDDGWLINGQKVWTSGAHHSDWGILLARTDPATTGAHGITYFVIDMKAPGVHVQPLVQINRGAHFNEVFLQDVRLPVDAAVGEIGEGWKVARTTLGAERMMIGTLNVREQVTQLIDQAKTLGRTEDPVIRQDLAGLYAHGMAVGLTGDRVMNAVRTGGRVGPEASSLKLGLSRMMEHLGGVAMRVLGADGLLEGALDGYGPLQDMFLTQWATRIGGGTEAIQRNTIGERALGLPREPTPEVRSND